MPIYSNKEARAHLNSDRKVTITGHTDNVGAKEYNLKLSLRGAEAVRDYLAPPLTRQGVDK
jgi:outer membrane protein OmpA-like peptidoglycan-associated protein